MLACIASNIRVHLLQLIWWLLQTILTLLIPSFFLTLVYQGGLKFDSPLSNLLKVTWCATKAARLYSKWKLSSLGMFVIREKQKIALEAYADLLLLGAGTLNCYKSPPKEKWNIFGLISVSYAWIGSWNNVEFRL